MKKTPEEIAASLMNRSAKASEALLGELFEKTIGNHVMKVLADKGVLSVELLLASLESDLGSVSVARDDKAKIRYAIDQIKASSQAV